MVLPTSGIFFLGWLLRFAANCTIAAVVYGCQRDVRFAAVCTSCNKFTVNYSKLHVLQQVCSKLQQTARFATNLQQNTQLQINSVQTVRTVQTVQTVQTVRTVQTVQIVTTI